jgi:hypothetical protein
MASPQVSYPNATPSSSNNSQSHPNSQPQSNDDALVTALGRMGIVENPGPDPYISRLAAYNNQLISDRLCAFYVQICGIVLNFLTDKVIEAKDQRKFFKPGRVWPLHSHALLTLTFLRSSSRINLVFQVNH